MTKIDCSSLLGQQHNKYGPFIERVTSLIATADRESTQRLYSTVIGILNKLHNVSVHVLDHQGSTLVSVGAQENRIYSARIPLIHELNKQTTLYDLCIFRG